MSTLIEITSVTPKTVSVIAKNQPLTISWTIGPNQTTNPSYIPTQASAKIGWRTSQEEEYQYTEISGATQEITYPANTFAGTGSVYFSLDVYDVSGTWNYKLFSYYPRLLLEQAMTGGAGVDEYYPDQTFAWNSTIFKSSVRPLGYFDKCSLFMFEAPSAAAYKYKAIFNAGIYSRVYPSNNGSGSAIGGDIKLLSDVFDPNTVTWNNMPIVSDTVGQWTIVSDGSLYGTMQQIPACRWSTTPAENSQGAAAIAVAKALMVTGPLNSSSNSRYISLGGTPVLRLWFIDQTVTSKPEGVSNTDGYVNPHVAQTFKWQHVPDGDYSCYGGWTTASATLYWSSNNGSTWHSVAAAASSSEVTLPANTLPQGTVKWYVRATDDQGTTADSDTYTISTADSAHTATPVFPNSSVENGDGPIRFIWTDASDTNTAPTGADLQYSTNGSSWTTFAQPRTSATETVAPASTFPAGTVLWRVRSLNADGVAGAWSDPLSFVCFAAPTAPIISTNGKPLLTVTWQSDGQQAYKVIVDGKTYGPYFGTSKSFTVPDFLSDGTHTVAVSVQNEYSLWSHIDPETGAGIISVTVLNIPGDPVTLTGLFDRDAELSWSTTDATSDYLIYRDGVQIGHASGRSFNDRVVLGYHSWRVINRLPGGYYTASNVVSGTLMTGRLAIAPLSGGAWLDLAKSENSARSVVWNESQRVALRQFAGQIYPQAEAAPYKTMSAGFDVAWTHAEAEQAAVFASLIGQPVIFKTPCEGAMVGILTAWQRNNMHFYRSYSATVQRIHWRDYVDADD